MKPNQSKPVRNTIAPMDAQERSVCGQPRQ
jgi:hypothetical protein